MSRMVCEGLPPVLYMDEWPCETAKEIILLPDRSKIFKSTY